VTTCNAIGKIVTHKKITITLFYFFSNVGTMIHRKIVISGKRSHAAKALKQQNFMQLADERTHFKHLKVLNSMIQKDQKNTATLKV
jgi:hypothetical protein